DGDDHLAAFLLGRDVEAADHAAPEQGAEHEAAQLARVGAQLLQVLVLQEHSRPEPGADECGRTLDALDHDEAPLTRKAEMNVPPPTVWPLQSTMKSPRTSIST